MQITDRPYTNLLGEDNAIEQGSVFCSLANSQVCSNSEDTDRTDRPSSLCDVPVLQDGTDGAYRSASDMALNKPYHDCL